MRVARTLLLLVVAAALGAMLAAKSARADQPDSLVLVVNLRNPIGSPSRGFLADAFLKKVTRWDDGETIRPVDLGPTSAVRRAFSERVLERSVAAVRSYWQQRIFSGRDVPPPELASEEAVLDYVQRNRGAVGYVSGNVHLHDVKVVAIR